MPDEQEYKWGFFREVARNGRRVTALIWKERKGLILGLGVFIVFASVIPFMQSGATGLLINELVGTVGSRDIEPKLILLMAFLVFSLVIPYIFYTVQAYFGRLFWFLLHEKFELLVIKRKGEIDVALHENPKHNDLFNKVSENGVWRVQTFVDRQFYMLQNIIEVVIASAILITFKWWILLVIILGSIPELITEAKYGRNVWDIHSGRAETRRRYWDLQSHFNNLPHLIELKLLGNTKHFLNLIKNLFVSFIEEEKRNDRRKMWRQLISICFGQGAVAAAIIFFAFQVLRGEIMIGTFTFLLTSIGNFRQSLAGFFSNLGRQYQDGLFVSDLFKLVDLPPVFKENKTPLPIGTSSTPDIVFENVTFAYPGKEPVLKNVSLSISPGEKVALVGINGAGKTTFVKLLCRFYDPQEGRILINGKDLREIDVNEWYSRLGIIFQDYAHYRFPVRDAIAIGNISKPLDLDGIYDAAQKSEADLFIKNWERGYDQMLGKSFTDGVEPSIGQWQKLALARIFYRDPDIFVLDEPTSSIDAEAEMKIFERLEKLPKNKSVILISHRFSTVRKANKICVIEEGALTEVGSHPELIERKGTYAKLFKLQAKGYK